MGFNSTLVRLRPGEVVTYDFLCTCFNSTLVRLRLRSVPSHSFDQKAFQFHIGSIKTCLLAKLLLVYRSILVFGLGVSWCLGRRVAIVLKVRGADDRG